MIKVMIVDDHPVVRWGLQSIFNNSKNSFIVCHDAEDGNSALRKLSKNKFDIVILEMKLRDMDGFEACKNIKKQNRCTKVIFFTIRPKESYAVRAFRAGASGYLSKADQPEELVNAIQKISQGGKYVSSSIAEILVDAIDVDTKKPLHEKLSEREFQIMGLLSEGNTVTQIGNRLFLSVKTISTYRSRILEKLHVKNNAELMSYAFRNGLVEY